MALQLVSIERVFLKVEGTEGVDASPAGTDAVQLMGNGTLAFGAEQENDSGELQNGLLDDAAPIAPGGKFCELSLRGRIRGLGATYTTSTTPEIHALLQGAGFLPAFAASQWTYDTASVSLKTLTAYCQHGANDGTFVQHSILAARCSTLAFRFPAGAPAEWSATLRGIYVAPTDVSGIVPTYQTAVPPIFAAAASWTYNSIAPVVRMATVSVPTPLKARMSGNSAGDGLVGYQQTKRAPTFDVDCEAQKIADFGAFADWAAATARTLLVNLGAAANNKFSITSDKAVFKPLTYKDDGGLWLFGGTGTIHPEGTNRVKLTFGA